MSTHASDIAHRIYEALDQWGSVVEVTEPVTTRPNVAQTFPNRDGLIEMAVLPRDHMRSFRVTVEAVALDDYYEVSP